MLQPYFGLGRDRRNKKSIWHQNKTVLVTAISLILNEAIVGSVCFAFIISRRNRWQRRHLKPHVRQNNPGCQCWFSLGTRNTFPSSPTEERSQQNSAWSRGFTAERNPLCGECAGEGGREGQHQMDCRGNRKQGWKGAENCQEHNEGLKETLSPSCLQFWASGRGWEVGVTLPAG